MKRLPDTSAEEIIRLSGSYLNAVNAIKVLERALWEVAFTGQRRHGQGGGRYKQGSKTQLLDSIAKYSEGNLNLTNKDEIWTILLRSLTAHEVFRETESGNISFDIDIFLPYTLTRLLLSNLKPDHELRYFVRRSVRSFYRCDLSWKTAQLFHSLGNAANSLRTERLNSKRLKGRSRSDHVWDYNEELLPYLESSLMPPYHNAKDSIDLFIESCREVGYIRPHYKDGYIELRATMIDAAYLLTNLFGMPTGIRGFDELFGGGGIMFTERLQPSTPSLDSDLIDGRTVLVRGRYGTGKSLLSLQLAVEVARKGGLAWVMPLEQSAPESLYTLQSMLAIPNDGSVRVAMNAIDASLLLEDRIEGRGALIILKTTKRSFDDFLVVLAENAKQMQKYPLRLMIVDPINSISIQNKRRRAIEPRGMTELRAQTLEALDEIKKTGTNILLVAEESGTPKEGLAFEQNIADTVIRLDVKKQYGYAGRYLEIKKSRLQREQRGEHPFSIISGTGLKVLPSSAAVAARIRPRTVRTRKDPIRLGLNTLDRILGPQAVAIGDVIAFQGSSGSFKTPLGLLFLLGSDESGDITEPRRRLSLLVAARDNESSLRYLLSQEFVKEHIEYIKNLGMPPKSVEDVIICALPSGYIQPGDIFQRIDDAFLDARLTGCRIDRVMIDNAAHWESSCPFIREDETFGDTLIDFLRRHRVTSLVTCGEVSQIKDSGVQRSIVDDADCLIQFDRFEFRGMHRVMLKVLKTRSMRHRRESFEIALGPTALEVKANSSLLRIVRGGEVVSVKIRLFLHSETAMQAQYNDDILHAIKSTLSEDTATESQNRIHSSRIKNLTSASAVDELQLLQLDEFQVPDLLSSDQNIPLVKFEAAQWDKNEWSDFLPRLAERIRSKDETFYAIPYYENISLLAYRSDSLAEKYTHGWDSLASACAQWEKEHKDPNMIFFDFPQGVDENYNCLFYEILLSLESVSANRSQCRLLKWLCSPKALEAGKLFRRLCRRAYFASARLNLDDFTSGEHVPPVNPKAIIWRHWYSTLNQMMSEIPIEERENIRVRPLPQGCSVAGEWFLGIPAYCASPDVGLEIIRLLTSHEGEFNRLRMGVGLPTRETFYSSDKSSNQVESNISPYFSMNMKDLSELVSGAFKRSEFDCYYQFSEILAYYLQRIIEIPETTDDEIEKAILNAFDSVISKMEFVRPGLECGKCHNGHK